MNYLKIFLVSVLCLNILGAESFANFKISYFPSNTFTMDIDGNVGNRREVYQSRYEEYDVKGGLGIALEFGGYPLQNNKQWEMIVGASYMPTREIANRRTKEKVNDIVYYDEDKYDPGLVWDDVQFVQVNSVYLKSRYLFDEPADKDSLVFYSGGKIAWNMLGIRHEAQEQTGGTIDNPIYTLVEEPSYKDYADSFGYGLFCGWLLNNTWDIELAYDVLNTAMRIEGGNGSLRGETFMSSLYFSVGYRVNNFYW